MLIVRHILLDNNERPTFYMNCNHNEILYHRNKLKVRHLFVSYREKEKYGIVLKKLKKRDSFHILLFIICLFCCTPIKYSQFYFTPVFHSAP